VIGPDPGLGAIVFPAVQLELINPVLWPDFPYRKLASYVDVWLPMVYWTFRTADYRDPYLYTDDSVTRLRARLHDSRAPVHPIGGIADSTSPAHYERVLQAVPADHPLGCSRYDHHTTSTRALPPPPARTQPPTATTP